jgi:hypothetical protein
MTLFCKGTSKVQFRTFGILKTSDFYTFQRNIVNMLQNREKKKESLKKVQHNKIENVAGSV